jgi:hypothetical protein
MVDLMEAFWRNPRNKRGGRRETIISIWICSKFTHKVALGTLKLSRNIALPTYRNTMQVRHLANKYLFILKK